MNNVSLVWVTPDADNVISYCARVSNPANQNNENITKLLQYCAKHHHWSVFEMASMCVEINTTRDIGRQILRHRSFSFQEMCVAEGTLVTTITKTGRIKKFPIEKLFTYQNNPRMDVIWDRGIRVYDELNKVFIRSTIKEIFNTGLKECFEVKLSDGKVLTCTDQHKFFTKTGFAKLADLGEGDFVAVNGVETYKSKDWMTEIKQESLTQPNRGIQYIAEKAGCSYHTIRKWLKIHGLLFTKKESFIVSGGIWNKGLPSEKQPNFGNIISEKTRNKMRESSRKGADSPFFKHGNKIPFRTQVWQWNAKWKNAILQRDGNVCVQCGATEHLEIDHKNPVYSCPEQAFDIDNLQVLCKKCHQIKSSKETNAAKLTVRWKKIVSIKPVGIKQTYDIEVVHNSHNYVANGIVTHNSQRYSNVNVLPPAELRECRLQDTKNRQSSLECNDKELSDWWLQVQEDQFNHSMRQYQAALDKGIAKEQARALLPEGLTSSRMYMTGTMRSWITYLQTRLDPSTQKEHRTIAEAIAEIFKTVAPVSYYSFFPGS